MPCNKMVEQRYKLDFLENTQIQQACLIRIMYNHTRKIPVFGWSFLINFINQLLGMFVSDYIWSWLRSFEVIVMLVVMCDLKI